MTQTNFNQGGEAPLQDATAFVAMLMNYLGTIQKVMSENEQLKQRVAALESENAALTDTINQWKSNDEWSNRVTYDNVVDLHALIYGLRREADGHCPRQQERPGHVFPMQGNSAETGRRTG